LDFKDTLLAKAVATSAEGTAFFAATMNDLKVA
jgi:hypothetical protein